VLIGTRRAPAGDQTIENILIQPALAQVAREQITTYQEQEKAAIPGRTLNEAKATAAAQTALTQSLIPGQVAGERGRRGAGSRPEGCRDGKVTAAASGEKSRLEGQGEADRVLAVGAANAQATSSRRRLWRSGISPWPEQIFRPLADALTNDQPAIVPHSSCRGGRSGEWRRPHPDRDAESMFGRMMPDALEKLKGRPTEGDATRQRAAE